jgi:hypothetical protein
MSRYLKHVTIYIGGGGKTPPNQPTKSPLPMTLFSTPMNAQLHVMSIAFQLPNDILLTLY